MFPINPWFMNKKLLAPEITIQLSLNIIYVLSAGIKKKNVKPVYNDLVLNILSFIVQN